MPSASSNRAPRINWAAVDLGARPDGDIAAELDVRRHTVTSARLRRGIPSIRPAGHVDLSRPDVFTSSWLDEPSSRWAIGLFVADGHLLAPRPTSTRYVASPKIQIEIDSTDRDGAEHFAHALGLPAARVIERQRPGLTSPNVTVSLQRPSVARLLDLGFNYGKKSATVAAPDRLADDIHFWRGVIDGDGYTSRSGRTIHLALRSNSEKLLQQFQCFAANRDWKASLCAFDTNGGGRCVLTGDNAAAAIRVLYAEPPTIARKRDKALRLADAWDARPRGTSKHRGVSWDKSRSKWTAQIGPRGAVKRLGRFDTELEAAQAVDEYLKTLAA